MVAWNCQGIGNPWTVRRLTEVCKKVDPDVLFLSETKNSHKVVAKKLNKLGFANLRTVGPQGYASGGLAILWKEGVDLTIVSSCKNYFDTKIYYEGKLSYCTFVYGNTDKRQRKQTWDYLTSLALIRDAAWFVTGDFNDITSNAEKTEVQNDQKPPLMTSERFSLKGTYMIYNMKVIHCRGKEKGEPTLSDVDLIELSPIALGQKTTHLEDASIFVFEGSDHRPLVTYFDPLRRKKKSIFRYDRRLNQNEEVSKIVEDNWTEDVHLKVKRKIDKCRTAIILWSKQQQECSKAHLEQIKREIEEATVATQPDEELLRNLNAELIAAYKAEEEFWMQRSRQLWLNLGDKNTGFFHASTKSRKAMNKFSVLEGEDGEPVYLEEEITSTIVTYFQNLFTATTQDPQLMSATLSDAIQPRVSDEQNAYLITLPSSAEIKEALFSINGGKAPGPDGFSACFFQTNWSVVGADIVKEIQEFFISGVMPRTINETHVRLIPKGREAKRYRITDLSLYVMCITKSYQKSLLDASCLCSKMPLLKLNLHLFQKGQYQIMF